MSGLRAAFQRLGTPDSVSWASFWVSLVAITAGHFTVPQTAPLLARLAALLVAQAALFVPLLGLRWFLSLDTSRPRPWLTIAAFAGASVFRAVVWTVALHSLGDVQDVSFGGRVLMASLPAFLPLVATGLAVTTIRAYELDTQRLSDVRRNLEDATFRVTGEIERSNEQALERVRARLNDELARLEGVDDSRTLEELRRLAGDVIRPLSHELAQSVPAWQPVAAESDIATRVDWLRVIRALGESGQFLPVTTGVFALLLYAPAAFILNSSSAIPVLVTIAIAIPATLTVANGVLDRMLPLKTPARSSALVVLAAVSAAAVCAVLAGVALGGSRGLAVVPPGTVFLTGAAIVGALIRSRVSAQQETAEELRHLTQQLTVQLVRLRQAQWYHQRALSRALHGAMQSAVTAAAIRLDQALADGVVPPHLLEETRASIAEQIDVLGSSADQPDPLDEVMERLRSMWSRVCEVELSADADARRALEQDGILRSTVSEVMTEAMSNSIRHGGARNVTVSMRQPSPGELLLLVEDDGGGHTGETSGGLGSRILNDCTSEWTFTSSGRGHVLEARLPLGDDKTDTARLSP